MTTLSNAVLVFYGGSMVVAALRGQAGCEVLALSNWVLGLIDEFLLMIHPLVLGSGRRLFPTGTPPVVLDLVASDTASTGVVIAT